MPKLLQSCPLLRAPDGHTSRDLFQLFECLSFWGCCCGVLCAEWIRFPTTRIKVSTSIVIIIIAPVNFPSLDAGRHIASKKDADVASRRRRLLTMPLQLPLRCKEVKKTISLAMYGLEASYTLQLCASIMLFIRTSDISSESRCHIITSDCP